MRQQSYGGSTFMQCARRCGRDWLLLLVLIVMLLASEEAPPRRMYITDGMLSQIKFPFQAGTVPSWAVPIYSTLVPSSIIVAHGALTQQPAAVTHAGVLGSLTSVALTADITNLFKLQVRALPCSAALTRMPVMLPCPSTPSLV